MTALAIGLVLLVLDGAGAPIAAAAQTPPDSVVQARLQRLEQWLDTLVRHTPGQEDEALAEVASWPSGDLRALWIDANVLVQVMRNPKLAKFVVHAEGQSSGTEIRYTPIHVRRLRVLACAASGAVVEPACMDLKAGGDLDAGLLALSALAREARLRGDDNYILRRGALLHGDVEMLAQPPSVPSSTTSDPRGALTFSPPGYRRSGSPASATQTQPTGPQRIRMDVADGLHTDLGQSPVHWELARMLLDYVKPSGVDRAAPGRDGMVLQWYRATAEWMQLHEHHEMLHLNRALHLFPDDPDLLFLSGSEHETYAMAAIQSAVRGTVFSLDVGSQRAELRRAEEFFRRALALKPDANETHLRLGRVLGRLGRHSEALAELLHVVAAIAEDESLLRYYGELFLGAEEEALGRREAARASYEHAAALYPAAQSPLVALSQLAWRSGDRAGALRAIQQVFALRPEALERDDPWWTYHVAQARDAEALLSEVRRPFLVVEPR